MRIFGFLSVILLISACSLIGRYSNGDVLVYVDEEHNKYHQFGCQYIDDNSVIITLVAAHTRGYEPDPVCSPPLLEEKERSRGASIFLFVIGGIVTAGIIFGIPFAIQSARTRNKARDIAELRHNGDWADLDTATQKQLIKETVKRLENPTSAAVDEEGR